MYAGTQCLTVEGRLIQKLRRMSGNFYSEYTLRHLTTDELYKLEYELLDAMAEHNRQRKKCVDSIPNIMNLLHALNSLTISLPMWPYKKDC